MSAFNVIERICAAVPKATTAVVLTHNIDFLFIENVLLPRLRDIGSPHLTIFADAGCAANTYRAAQKMVSRLGSRYRVVPVDLGPGRRFHPKALFLCGEQQAALAVGSGNATNGGWSANKEIWTDFLHPGEGGAQIAAFRDYLAQVLTRVPDPAELQRNTVAAFSDPAHTWIQDLPTPSGLAWTPNAIPLLDQIVAYTGEDIDRIDVLSPYFDLGGEALGRLAATAKGNVRVLLQPGRAGLSQDIAKGLPSNVRLASIEAADDEMQRRFIHAKLYHLTTPAGAVLAVGSANCSQAALLSNQSWGNAELVALSRPDDALLATLWDGFMIVDSAPELPPEHPSPEWEDMAAPDLRILSARKEGNRLQVHFKAAKPFKRLYAQAQASEKLVSAEQITETSAVFHIEGRATYLVLHAVGDDGAEFTSAPSWIDDEWSLRMGGHERALGERLDDAANKGSMSGNEFLGILELYGAYTQKPVAVASRKAKSDSEASDTVITFNEDDIYSDGFARPASLFDGLGRVGASDADPLSMFASFFRTADQKQPSGQRPSPPPPEDDEDPEGNKKPKEVQEAEDKAERQRIGPRIARMLARIETGVARPDFVSSRPPERLAKDIWLLVLFIATARMKEFIDAPAYRERMLSLWRILFFGKDGDSGSIPLHISSLPEEHQPQFIKEMRSPLLTAAMALSCMIEWENADVDAKAFRFSAALLAHRYPWLVWSDNTGEIIEALEEVATNLLPVSGRARLAELWLGWVRDGHAMSALYTAFGKFTQPELAKLCHRRDLKQGELIWNIKHGFCVLGADFPKASMNSLELAPVSQTKPFKTKPEFLSPLADLLNENNIDLSENVRRQVFSLMHGIDIPHAS